MALQLHVDYTLKMNVVEQTKQERLANERAAHYDSKNTKRDTKRKSINTHSLLLGYTTAA